VPNTGSIDTSARLLRLLSLLQSRWDWTGAALAERLGVTPRTVRRDVERLRGLGYPIRATPGVAGGYRLEAGAALPPLLLEDDEAVAVAVGLRTAAGGTVSGLEEAAVRASAKLEQLLPARLRDRLTAVHSATERLPDQGPAIDLTALAVIAAACRGRERLRFGYRDGSGTATSRYVEPFRLVHTGRRWYLVARDIDRDDWRTFRVDRVTGPTPTGARFTRHDPPDAAAFVASAITTRPYAFSTRVRLRAPIATVAERVPPTVGTLEAVDDSTCVLTTGANSLDALAVHLALIGVDFDVLEPPELMERIAAMAERLAAVAARTRASDLPAGQSAGDARWSRGGDSARPR
jgi:predicted DNA-binding transcriptional regulator YafY